MAKLNVAITGASGLIGTALTEKWRSGGHRVIRVVRKAVADEDLVWDPERHFFAKMAQGQLEALDAVIHLAGENVGGGRWTDGRKDRILKSRVEGTRFLAETLAQLKQPPRVWICASAVGIYGHQMVAVGDENSPLGSDFLAQVCKAWEAACEPARKRGIRVVNARFGVVLAEQGGALKKMLPPFRLGLGGRLGDGKQWMSWVAMADVLGAIHHAVQNENVSGPISVVSPHPVTNQEFSETLGRVLRRPAVFPVPAAVVRLAFGEMGSSLLLGSTGVLPKKLLDSGYAFVQPALEKALQIILHRPSEAEARPEINAREAIGSSDDAAKPRPL